jgi:hypothetical protein
MAARYWLRKTPSSKQFFDLENDMNLTIFLSDAPVCRPARQSDYSLIHSFTHSLIIFR